MLVYILHRYSAVMCKQWMFVWTFIFTHKVSRIYV